MNGDVLLDGGTRRCHAVAPLGSSTLLQREWSGKRRAKGEIHKDALLSARPIHCTRHGLDEGPLEDRRGPLISIAVR